MHCTRCDGITPDATAITLTNAARRESVWSLCVSCQAGLQTWYMVRKAEFPAHSTEAVPKINAELLHACRMALDAVSPYTTIRDVLRTAIRGALR